MIEIKNLKKKYGKFVAIEDFNLNIEEGKIYGILGRMNSGGTTIFNVLSNYILRDGGEVLIDGKQPEDSRDILYMCPKMEFYSKYTFKKVLKIIKKFNDDFDYDEAINLCNSFKIDLNEKVNITEHVSTCTVFKIIVTLCMNKKYLLFNKPEIGVSSLDIRKLSDIICEKSKEREFTPIIHSKTVNYFFDYVDEVIIINDKKVVLFESKEKLEKNVYSVSGSSELIGTAVQGKNVIAIRTLKDFSKLKVAYIMADSPEEARKYSNRIVPLKELYEAITSVEGGSNE